MAAGDEFLFETAKRVVLSSLRDPEAIVYRQQVLADCLEHPDDGPASSTSSRSRRSRASARSAACGAARPAEHDPSPVGAGARAARRRPQAPAADRRRAGESFRSEGFTRFFAMLRRGAHRRLPRRRSSSICASSSSSAACSRAPSSARATRAVATSCAGNAGEQSWKERLPFAQPHAEQYSFAIAPRDEAGVRALEEIRGQGDQPRSRTPSRSRPITSRASSRCSGSSSHSTSAASTCASGSTGKGEPTCFPEPLAAGSSR